MSFLVHQHQEQKALLSQMLTPAKWKLHTLKILLGAFSEMLNSGRMALKQKNKNKISASHLKESESRFICDGERAVPTSKQLTYARNWKRMLPAGAGTPACGACPQGPGCAAASLPPPAQPRQQCRERRWLATWPTVVSGICQSFVSYRAFINYNGGLAESMEAGGVRDS